jgi:hypothetical protein
MAVRMQDVPTWRLNLMRVAYLLMFVFLVSSQWPRLFDHGDWSRMHSVAVALLGALGLLAGLALRYPLQMLPVLLFEILWKLTWLVMVALPLWKAGPLAPEFKETAVDCLFGMILMPIVIPWKYVWANYVRKPGERWWGPPRTAPHS